MPDPLIVALTIAALTSATSIVGLIMLLRRLFDIVRQTNENIAVIADALDPKLSQVTFPPIEDMPDDYFEKLRESLLSPGTITSSNIDTPTDTLSSKLVSPPIPDEDNPEWQYLGNTTTGAEIHVRPVKEDDNSWLDGVEPPTPTPPPENAAEIDIETHTLRPAGTLPPKARHGK